MMGTIGPQVCKMLVLGFVAYEVESFWFCLGGKDQERLLRRNRWSSGSKKRIIISRFGRGIHSKNVLTRPKSRVRKAGVMGSAALKGRDAFD